MTTQSTRQEITCRQQLTNGLLNVAVQIPMFIIGQIWGFAAATVYAGVFLILIGILMPSPALWGYSGRFLPLDQRRVQIEIALGGGLAVITGGMLILGLVHSAWVLVIPFAAITLVAVIEGIRLRRQIQLTATGDPVPPRPLSEQSKRRIRLEASLVGATLILAGALHGMGVVESAGIYAIPIALGVGILFVEPEMWGGQASEGE
jgi:hypothetical protein